MVVGTHKALVDAEALIAAAETAIATGKAATLKTSAAITAAAAPRVAALEQPASGGYFTPDGSFRLHPPPPQQAPLKLHRGQGWPLQPPPATDAPPPPPTNRR